MNRNSHMKSTTVFHIDNLSDAALQLEAIQTAFSFLHAVKDISYLVNEDEVALQTPNIPPLWPARPV